MEEGERLQKTLARAGYGSRRACEVLIVEGRVTIDGRVAELGNRVNPDVQVICVDGNMAPTSQSRV
ncbi:MAG: S4 domain-containing protein, partial [Acidimicrobiales bacterium]